jgi:hypothetical protein
MEESTKILEIIKPAYFKYNNWWVKVKYKHWSGIEEKEIMFKSEEEAKSIKIGSKC